MARVYTEEQKEARRVRERARSATMGSDWHRARTSRYRRKLKIDTLQAYSLFGSCPHTRAKQELVLANVEG